MSVPAATTVPLAIGRVPATSPNMLTSLETVAPTLDVIVNGPMASPTRPRLVFGEITRLGGGGCTAGPAATTAATIAAVTSWSGSSVRRTYLSLKNQTAACTAAAFASASPSVAGSSVCG